MFVLDSSIGIKPEDFVKVLNFCKKFLNQLNIDNGEVRIGIVTFSSKYTIEFNLNDFATKRELEQAIDRIPWRYGSTNTAQGIRAMHLDMFTPSKGDRPNAPNIAIITTYGPSINPQSTTQEAMLAKAKGVHIFAVGLGLGDLSEISSMASEPTGRNTFFIPSFVQLGGLEDEIIASSACPGICMICGIVFMYLF